MDFLESISIGRIKIYKNNISISNLIISAVLKIHLSKLDIFCNIFLIFGRIFEYLRFLSDVNSITDIVKCLCVESSRDGVISLRICIVN